MQLTSPAATVATLGLLEVQEAADAVTFSRAPDAKVAVAASCNLPPARISQFFSGVTLMDLSAGATQFTVVEAVVVPVAVAAVAEIAADPPAWQLTRPADTVAMLGALETQVAVEVRSCTDPSVQVPLAVNCAVPPAAICGA